MILRNVLLQSGNKKKKTVSYSQQTKFKKKKSMLHWGEMKI